MPTGPEHSGQIMEVAADTGMIGGAAVLGTVLAESGALDDASAGVVGAIAAVLLRAALALLPDLIAYCRVRLQLWRAQTAEEIDDITGEHKPGEQNE